MSSFDALAHQLLAQLHTDDTSAPARVLAQAQRSLQRQPRHRGLLRVAMLASSAMGNLPAAEQYAQLDAAADPRDPDALYNLALMQAGQAASAKQDAACATLAKVLALRPNHPPARVALANLLITRNRPSQAEAVARGVPAESAGPKLLAALALALQAQARAHEALAVLDDALARVPSGNDPAGATDADTEHLAILRCVLGHQSPEVSPQLAAQRHRWLGQLLERRAGPMLPQRTPAPAPRTLGFLGPDLRRHSVAYFIEPLFEALRQAPFAERWRVHAYSNSPIEDAVSQRLRASVAVWRNVSSLSDDALARVLADDGVDVLIDLAGLTNNHRLPLLARKPAPLVATYCGYPDTTGLASVDVRIVDAHTDPVGVDDRCTERLLRLDPCFLCYRPPTEAPDVRPREPGAPVTFVSFNAARKLNSACATLWAGVLRALPGSRLRLKALDFADDGARAVARGLFERAGVLDRVDILPPTPPTPTNAGEREHLAQYHHADIALDTHPYHGTTTTCEALWMGVPVVTLARPMDRHVARVGASLLHAAGLPELVAPDEASFVSIAVDLASDAPRLAQLRATLRQRLAGGVLCDAPRFAATFTSAIESAWVQRFAR